MKPDPPIIFDFKSGRVYRASEGGDIVRDLMKSLRSFQEKVVMRVAGTPPPPQANHRR